MRALIVLLIILVPTSALSQSSAAAGLQECAKIANAAERLFCFDSLAARTAPDSRTAPPAAAHTSSKDLFGLEMKTASETDEVVSRHRGRFLGWSGDTVFELENGQVWQQAEPGSLRYNAESPVITIKRGWFGAYYLKVQGRNKRIKVKRVK